MSTEAVIGFLLTIINGAALLWIRGISADVKELIKAQAGAVTVENHRASIKDLHDKINALDRLVARMDERQKIRAEVTQ